jgi:hypothetical protein
MKTNRSPNRRPGALAALVGLAALAAAAGCTPETLTIAETDLVVTVESEEADYGALRTYALTDAVTDLCSNDLSDLGLGRGGAGGSSDAGEERTGCSPLPTRLDDVVLESLEANMDALGYTKVELDENPDVTLLVGTVVSTEWYYVPGYVWCDPYYYYYCWYPSSGYVYEFSRGSILINMVQESTGRTVDSVWFAALNGLYESSSEVSGPDRVQAMVDRAFEQSPYLAEGGDR